MEVYPTAEGLVDLLALDESMWASWASAASTRLSAPLALLARAIKHEDPRGSAAFEGCSTVEAERPSEDRTPGNDANNFATNYGIRIISHHIIRNYTLYS